MLWPDSANKTTGSFTYLFRNATEITASKQPASDTPVNRSCMLPLSTVSTSYTITFFLITHGADEVIAVVMGRFFGLVCKAAREKAQRLSKKPLRGLKTSEIRSCVLAMFSLDSSACGHRSKRGCVGIQTGINALPKYPV